MHYWYFSTFAVPFILIGNKVDLRTDPATIERLALVNQSPVTWEDGYFVAKNTGAYAYLECSVITNQGVQEVFEVAARIKLLPENIQLKLQTKSLEEKFKSLKTSFKFPKPKKDQPRRSKLVYIVV